MDKLSHIDESGAARMVDISGKQASRRVAVARASVSVGPETLETIRSNAAKKGDVLGVARIAGILGAKRTPELIPLCHPIPLASVDVEFNLVDEPACVHIESRVATTGSTGVEMEALTAVSVAALTVYDMIKSMDRSASINDVHLAMKDGGKSGRFERST